MRFTAGRAIPVLVLPEGREYVHVIDGGSGEPALQLPEGWRLREVSLDKDWIVRLPRPATVFFFPRGDSFQGPIPANPDRDF